MDQSLKWLPDAAGTAWEPLAQRMHASLAVPSGFIVCRSTPEERVRAAYEELKIQEKTHFVAVRGATHGVLNVIGPDALIHTLRRLWAGSPHAPILVQRMVHATWCGKTQRDGTIVTIKANEGMQLLDPDTYIVNSTSRECVRRVLEAKQRKMVRHVDGSARVVSREGDRTPMPEEHLARVAELSDRAHADIGWAIDDLEKLWLLSVSATSTL